MIDRRGFLAVAGLSVAGRALAGPLGEAINAAADRLGPRVVRLRYLGDGGDAIGAAPVSGVLLGEGWVLTSDYGLETDPAAILCQTAEGEEFGGRLVARDRSRRLALVRLVGVDGAAPTVRGRPAVVGETAIALGRVFRADRVSLTTGVVSAVGRFGGRAIQTDAAASPVNYGGPLVGLDGALLGVLTPLSPPGQSGVGLYDSGVGFAVPVAAIAERIDRLAAGEDIQPGWMGLSTQAKDTLRAAARIQSLVDDGPADRAGLKSGDTIVELAGRPIRSVWSLQAIAGGLDAGQTVSGRVKRSGGGEEDFQITLAVRPEKTETPGEAEPAGEPTKKPGELD